VFKAIHYTPIPTISSSAPTHRTPAHVKSDSSKRQSRVRKTVGGDERCFTFFDLTPELCRHGRFPNCIGAASWLGTRGLDSRTIAVTAHRFVWRELLRSTDRLLSSFSRFARRLLALRPAHSHGHQFMTRFTRRLQPCRVLHSCSGCFRREHPTGPGLHALENAALLKPRT
jgi:hypothetical protein